MKSRLGWPESSRPTRNTYTGLGSLAVAFFSEDVLAHDQVCHTRKGATMPKMMDATALAFTDLAFTALALVER